MIKVKVKAFTKGHLANRNQSMGMRRGQLYSTMMEKFCSILYLLSFTGPGRGSGKPQTHGRAVAEVLPVVPQLLPSAHLHKRLIYELSSKNPHFTGEKPRWRGRSVGHTRGEAGA